MRIQYTERDKHLVEELAEATDLANVHGSGLREILDKAARFKRPVGEVVTIMSVNCRECGDDFFGINPCRDAIESTGWCGCKEAAQ